jgi:hypothetical protein
MPRLYEYVLDVRKMSREDFAAAHPYPFLLLYRDVARAKEGWSFKTQTISVATTKLARLAAGEELQLSPELAKYDVYPVVKALSNPWPERVSVGRARNNDIVLGDSSVSKLHAHFKREPGDSLYLVDAGSRNGTRLNDRCLKEDDPVKLEIGDTITFGRTSMTFLDAMNIHDLVSKHIQVVGSHI